MYELAKIAGYLIAPLTIAMVLWLAAAFCALAGRRRAAIALACIAFAGLWVASMPIAASALNDDLERRYPVMPVQAAPTVDAIVVLGGAVVPAKRPGRQTYGLTSASDRVWQAAALYRAGKAKWLLVAAGGVPEFPGQPMEAEAIAEMLTVLGVPRSALLLDTGSRNTRENAANALRLLEGQGLRRVLLVTSAQHMPRAMQTFAKVWGSARPEFPPVVAFPSDAAALQVGHISLKSFLPAVEALENVTTALKEYAGMLALAMI
jgi:uncharacterized SAM-binding protein YcdF (DUF218 family)